MRESPWRLALLAILGAAYLWLGHLGSTMAHPPAISLLSGLMPVWVLALLLAWASRQRIVWLGVLLAVSVGLFWNLDFLRQNTAWVYFAQHAGTHALLGIAFGRTLFSGHAQALCSKIARIAHKGLSEEMARYTWQVTLAWTLYFFSATLISVCLFAFAPLKLWSVFANLLTAPLLGLMFAVEYVVRRKVLPNEHHLGILATIRAYREYSRHQDSPQP